MAIFDTYTKLCSHFDGADAATAYTDPIAGAATFVGTAQLDTAQKKFGPASLLLDGNSDYVTYPDSASWNFGTGDFTLDGQVKFNQLPASGLNAEILSQYVDGDHEWHFDVANDAGTYKLRFISNNNPDQTAIQQTMSPQPSTGTWYHLAIVRSGNSWYLFQDGVQLGSTSTDTDDLPNLAAVLTIGNINSTHYFNGYIDELRISKGIARWTANFTPFVRAYPIRGKTIFTSDS